MSKASEFAALVKAFESAETAYMKDQIKLPAFAEHVDDFGVWCRRNRGAIARALRTQEMVDTAISDNDLVCGSCGDFCSGDPPALFCRATRDRKHTLLVHLDLKKVPK